MHSVGTRLREARERKGFSLDEINARTCINSKNLAAIERDAVKEISSPFFYRSFVRQYAEQVDVDFRALAPSVEMLAGNMRQPDLPGQGEHQPVRVAPVQPRPKRDLKWVIPASILTAAVVLGSGGFAAWMYYAPLLHARAAVSLVTPAKPVPAPIVKPPERIHLELSATERTWLSVTADGKPAYTGVLEKAQTKVLDSQETAKLRTGNAGGVDIHFNGKDIGAIGPRGKTRTVVFTKTGYEVQSYDGASPIPANHIGG